MDPMNRDPYEADFSPRIHCPFCGYPRSAHRAPDRVEEFRDQYEVQMALATSGLDAVERTFGRLGEAWLLECKRLMDADAAQIAAEAERTRREEREERRAERANRRWEEGLL